MLYYIYNNIQCDLIHLNVFKYISFRSIAALVTSMVVFFLMGEKFINFLSKFQGKGQPISKHIPKSHQAKQGTPTMGGIMILIAVTLSTLVWADLSNPYLLITLFGTLSFGALGFADDYTKIKQRNNTGISGKSKLFWQFTISFVAFYFITQNMGNEISTSLAFPFFKNYILDLGYFYFIFAAVVITGCSNAVNLTDGLDGLAVGPIMIATSCFAIISYLVGNAVFSNYLILNHVPNAGELAVFCATIVGACIGFLWYNAPPAQIFMGDVGSLALGAAIGIVSVITKHEIVLSIIGGLFVIEALSVILQLYSYKVRGKRLFLMAPIHHHFEKLGWSETKVVLRFWIIAFVFALLGLSTLKLR